MEKDENKSIQIKNAETTTSVGALRYFSTNSSFVFILKKTEKLVSAIYLISGFFDNEEPLKWNLRNISAQLLSVSLELKNSNGSEKEKIILNMEGKVLEITSLLLIAKNSGLISEMNYSIINKEFNIFADILAHEGKLYKTSNENNFSANYFDVSMPDIGPISNEDKIKSDSVSLRDKSTNSQVTTSMDNDVLNDFEKKNSINSSFQNGQRMDETLMAKGNYSKSHKEAKPLKEFGAVAVKKNSRQSIIISLLRRKKEIMIKDVSPLIHGCSEKTIQRELLSMVDKGILVKHGEKRWSRYSLAQ